MKKLDFSTPEQISLESQLDRIALEYAFLDNAKMSLLQVMPTLQSFVTDKVNIIKGLLDTKSDNDLLLRDIDSKYRKLVKKLNIMNFIDYENMLVSVPEDFKGNLLIYSVFLNNNLNGVYLDTSNILKEYNIILTNFINEKDIKQSLQLHNKLFKDSKLKREKLTNNLSNFFDNKDRSKVRLKDVMSRFNDIPDILKNSNNLGKTYKHNNLLTIKQQVTESVELLNVLNDIVKKTDKVSGEYLYNISQGCYEIGSSVEFASLMHFKTNQFITTFDNLLNRLEEI